jgi:uncharacterized membrane protein
MFRRVYLAGALMWAAMIPAGALASLPGGSGAAYAFALSVYAFGHVICHQLPARSFQLSGVVLPVCARCTGIYAGAAVASLGLIAAGRFARSTGALVTASASRRVLAAALAPTAVTLVYEWTTGNTPANWIRAMAGVPLGAAVTWLVGSVRLDR